MQQQEAKRTTETGIDITAFMEREAAGHAKIVKPIGASENYLVVEAQWTVQPTPAGGAPMLVETEPTVRNINRQSLLDFEAALVAQEEQIANARKQLAALSAAMEKADKK